MAPVVLPLIVICSVYMIRVSSTEHCDKVDNTGHRFCRESTNNIGIAENERRILLIGKTGVGKSTTGNTILGKRLFEAKTSGTSITTKTKLGYADRYGRKLLVVDTPGLYDTNKTNEEVMIEITKCYGITAPGLHAIVLVVEVGRFTAEENETVHFFLEKFGEGVIQFLIVAFTGKDKLEREDETIDDYVNTLHTDSSLNSLLKRIQKRYVVFGYKGRQEDREKEVQHFLHMVDTMIGDNGGQFYTNEMYNEAEKILQQRWEEEKKREKEKHDQEINDALASVKERYKNECDALMEELREKQRQYLSNLEQNERKHEKHIRQREKEFREKIRQESQKGQGGFFEKIFNFIGNFLWRKLWPFSN